MADLLQLLPEAGLLITQDGEIVEANAPFAQLLGRRLSTLPGTNIRDLMEDESGRVQQCLKLCAGSRALLPLVVRWKRADGNVADCRCDAGLAALGDGEDALRGATIFIRCRSQNEAIRRFTVLNEKIHALSTEIAERRRAEEAMHDSEERYRTLVAATSSVVWSADAAGRFTAFQPDWEDFTGQAGDEYTGDAWLDTLHPDDRDRARKHWRDSLTASRRYDLEARVWQARAGAYRRCILRAVPIREGERGEVKEWIGTLTDIEDQKQFEDQLRQAQRLESLGVLAGGVAHDFNNLLVGILGNASLALETISSSSPARLMLKDVVAASESAATLTRQLLAYAGKGRFLIEPIDVSVLIREIRSLVQTSIPRTIQL
ncbi:MAG: PAS domain S-box protein, partial [Acidobacteriota bacterium]|nr:PAS domain S-box protein [Acidobacteriota bacterium]